MCASLHFLHVLPPFSLSLPASLPPSLSPCCPPLQGSLHPHSYQANLGVWGFYLDNFISQFPPYDTELMSANDLTPLDLQIGRASCRERV